jgi:hypothetical protein
MYVVCLKNLLEITKLGLVSVEIARWMEKNAWHFEINFSACFAHAKINRCLRIIVKRLRHPCRITKHLFGSQGIFGGSWDIFASNFVSYLSLLSGELHFS